MKQTENGLGAWQLTMMALGSVIGGSFFLGSAVAIHATGPSIVLAFALGGVLVYFILHALSEMTVASASTGSFRKFAAQAFGNGAGFVVGWVYWTGMVLAMSSEATAISILLRNWIPDLSIWLMGSAVIICVTLINLLGANQLSKLESGLALVKVFAIVFFILLALSLIAGVFTSGPAIGLGVLMEEPLFTGGWKGLVGSMLIVMFTYAGFEIIGLASSEVRAPKENIPKAIHYTVISLVGLYILSNAVLLPLIPTADISKELSPLVAALNRHGIVWAGTVINIVLITAILSTMLAAMFGVGRMMGSLVKDRLAPGWLYDKQAVPYRGILFSGLSMLVALWFGMFFPSVYLFLISAGGFSILFAYTMIMATHIEFRRKKFLPAGGQGQKVRFPYASLVTFLALLVVIMGMPFVEGQVTGMIAGGTILALYAITYLVIHVYRRNPKKGLYHAAQKSKLQPELSEELGQFASERKSDHKAND
jgi:L-asparagine transporter-like permease